MNERLAVEISCEQTYNMLFNDFREAVSNAMWFDDLDALNRTIAKWRTNLSILPEEESEALYRRLKHDIGIE